MQLDKNKTLWEQSGLLPYDIDFEYPRSFLRIVKNLGSGAFGEVNLYQAYQIGHFSPRDKSAEAMKRRKKMREMTNVNKKIDKHLEQGNRLTLVAVKILKGMINDL